MAGRIFLAIAFAAVSLSGEPRTGRIRFQTRLGGSGDEAVRGFARDKDGNFYVTGTTLSTDFPATVGDTRARSSTLYRIRKGQYEPIRGPFDGGQGPFCIATNEQVPGLLAVALEGVESRTRVVRLLRSRDAGSSWERFDEGLPAVYSCASLVASADGETFYLLSLGQFWIRSAGGKWRSLPAPWSNAYVAQLVAQPLSPHTIVAYGSSIWFSADDGESWTSTPETVRAMATVDNAPGLLYATNEKGILRSTDAGRTWTVVSSLPRSMERGETSGAIAADPNEPLTLYWTSYVSSWVTRDGGLQWQPLSLGAGTYDFHTAWASKTVLATTGGMIWTSSNGGREWEGKPIGSKGSGIVSAGLDVDGEPVWYARAGPSRDAFLAKFDHDGKPVWATYFGGSGNDDPVDLILDPRGDIWVAGNTTSGDFPATPGTYDRKGPASASKSPFIVKFSASGSIVASSVLLDFPAEVLAFALDQSGSPLVAGFAYAGLPTTANAIQPAMCCEPYPRADINYFPPPPSNAFLEKMDPAMSKTLTSTYFWGRELGGTRISALGFDRAGNVLVGGAGLAVLDPGATRSVIYPSVSNIESIMQASNGSTYLVTRSSGLGCPPDAVRSGAALVEVDISLGFSVRSCTIYPFNGMTIGESALGGVIAAGQVSGPLPTIGAFQVRGSTALVAGVPGLPSFATYFGETPSLGRPRAIDWKGSIAVAFDTARLAPIPSGQPDYGAGEVGALPGSDVVLLEASIVPESGPRIDNIVEAVKGGFLRIAPTERVRIKGAGFSKSATVYFGDELARVYAASESEILVEAPEDWHGSPWVTVRVEDTAGTSNEVRVSTRILNLTMYPTVLNPDGSVNTPERFASPGDTIGFPVNGIKPGAYMTFHLYCQPVPGCGRILTAYELSMREVPGIPGQVLVANVPIPRDLQVTPETKITVQAWTGANGVVSYDAVDVYVRPRKE
ncbi:MAG: SBBP repeat-containing protein [Bryobacteraceae bacterium]